MPTIKEHRQAAAMVSERYTGYTFQYIVEGRVYHSHGHAMRAALAILKRQAIVDKIRKH